MNLIQSTRVFCLLLILFSLPAWGETTTDIPENAVWIDVRSPQEFASGHVKVAHSIPFDRIAIGITELKLSKETPIYLYCAVGGRAGIAKKSLDALGYAQVTNVGGLDDAQKLLSEADQHTQPSTP